MTQETEAAPPGYSVTREKCFRCATCSSLAPEVFAMEQDSARVVRQPQRPAERAACEAARIACPGFAIGFRGPGKGLHVEMDMASAPPPSPAAPLFPRLFDEAERVRWRMTEVPWDAVERDKVTPGFVRFVREMALSELTTFSATRRFLSEMADDVDFSSWAAVWFYEETKHPEALFRWLSAFGVTVPPSAVQRGRVTAPFMRSRTGTLVMNVLSELFASSGYQDVARHTKEPVLARIAKNLAGDEARHGAAFYLFAERAIAAAKSPDFERLQAVKVLYYWVQAADHVEHPVNQFHEKVSADPELREVLRDIGTDYAPILSRACRLIGTLIGRPLAGPEDVLPALREMSGGKD
jgi:ferredoxin